MSLKLCTLNIEGDRHLHRWPAVVKAERPDVVCLQEVFAADMERIEVELGMSGSFFPMMEITQINTYHLAPRGLWGVAIFSNLPFTSGIVPSTTLSTVQNGGITGYYYAGLPTVQSFTAPNDASRVLAVGTFVKEGAEYTIGTTHFTWSGKGEPTDEQRIDVRALLQVLQEFSKIVFCGDFNAPRGTEIFSTLETYYTDTLPKTVQTTIDLQLHYAAPLYLVVDTIFATPHYKVSQVHTLSSVSDHIGVVGEVTVVA